MLEITPLRLVLSRHDSRFRQVALSADLLQHAGHDRLQVVEEIRSLGHEVAHSRPQGLDDQVLILQPGHQDGRHVMAGLFDPAEKIQAGRSLLEPLVQHDQLDRSVGDL